MTCASSTPQHAALDTPYALVLDFVSSPARPSGRLGQEVLDLAGTIDADDLATMRQVAGDDCEQIDPHDW